MRSSPPDTVAAPVRRDLGSASNKPESVAVVVVLLFLVVAAAVALLLLLVLLVLPLG